MWCAGRFFLYTSYYAIFGALFGVQNFGRMVAIDNSVNGLFGLLQLPLTQWGLHGLGGNFTAINLIQVCPGASCVMRLLQTSLLVCMQMQEQCLDCFERGVMHAVGSGLPGCKRAFMRCAAAMHVMTTGRWQGRSAASQRVPAST